VRVQVFFTISGFIITLTMGKGQYSISQLLTFLSKRLIRLHPTYLAAMAATAILSAGATYAKSHSIDFPTAELLKASVYLHIFSALASG
jgi:peptidoglycan/LPS O-acetylase OafA/YrhL